MLDVFLLGSFHLHLGHSCSFRAKSLGSSPLPASAGLFAEERHQLPPELAADAAVDDEVDGRVEDQEEVVDVGQDVDGGRDVIPAQPEAGLEVLHRVGLRVGELEDLERESVRVAGDEDEHDAGQRHGRLLAPALESARLDPVRAPVVVDRLGVELLDLDGDGNLRLFVIGETLRPFDERGLTHAGGVA